MLTPWRWVRSWTWTPGRVVHAFHLFIAFIIFRSFDFLNQMIGFWACLVHHPFFSIYSLNESVIFLIFIWKSIFFSGKNLNFSSLLFLRFQSQRNRRDSHFYLMSLQLNPFQSLIEPLQPSFDWRWVSGLEIMTCIIKYILKMPASYKMRAKGFNHRRI